MTAEGNPARVQVIHPETPPHDSAQLNSWLEQLVSRKGSDLLLVPHAHPSVRVEGTLVTIGDAPLTGDEIEAAVLPALAKHAREDYQGKHIADSSYRVEGLGRFRINLHHERGRAAATVRALPSRIRHSTNFIFRRESRRWPSWQRGLVIIGGATGSGKTTTLAALVNDINQREARHIVTIEDPIEYEHSHNLSVIEQVEIGIDAPDFPTALRAALRQAPDVIVLPRYVCSKFYGTRKGGRLFTPDKQAERLQNDYFGHRTYFRPVRFGKKMGFPSPFSARWESMSIRSAWRLNGICLPAATR